MCGEHADFVDVADVPALVTNDRILQRAETVAPFEWRDDADTHCLYLNIGFGCKGMSHDIVKLQVIRSLVHS